MVSTIMLADHLVCRQVYTSGPFHGAIAAGA